MVQAYKDFWTRGIEFDGSSTRPDFWWVYLANFIIYFVLQLPILLFSGGDSGGSAIGTVMLIVAVLYGLAALIPNIALVIRRLHDGGFSGWFILLGLVPFIGGLILLVFMLMPSKY